MTSRKERAEQTREKLMEVGLAFMNKRGYEDISVEEITKACGVSKGTFYTYFKSKRELFGLIRYDVFNHLDDQLTEPAGKTIQEMLRCYIVEWVTQLGTYSTAVLANWLGNTSNIASLTEYSEDGGIADDFADARRQNIVEAIRRAVDREELEPDVPAEDIAWLITSLLFGADVWYCLLNGRIELREWSIAQANLVVSILDQYVPER